MRYIFDEDSANTAYADRAPQEKEERAIMHAVSDVLHNLYPNCNIEIRAKLAIEGLSEEELNMVW